MIPFLPEMPSVSAFGPGPLAIGGVLPQAPVLRGAGAVAGGPKGSVNADFAGLLDTALPRLDEAEQAPTDALTVAEAEVAATPLSAAPPAVLPVPLSVPVAAPVAASRMPSGTVLPGDGTQLPPAAAPLLQPQPRFQAQQPPPRTVAAALLLADTPHASLTPLSAAAAAAAPAPAATFAAPAPTPVPTPGVADDRAAAAAPATPAIPAPAALDAPSEPAALPASDPVAATASDPAPAAPVDPAELPALVAAIPLVPAPVAATEASAIPPRQAPRGLLTPAAPPARAELARMPARVTLPPAPLDETADPVTPTATPAPAALLEDTAAPAPASTAPSPTPALAAAPAPAPVHAAIADRAEPRAAGPQQESTIAQVGDLREALRTARPELTMRHAEFGFVSLRLEQAGAEGWRAVLASRDPGFVPAIQAALADRAVTASTAAADAGTNGSFLGQNGTSDPRYGSSHSGGQGSSQPYLGQSGSRDGEAAPDHRRSSTTAVLTARAEEGEAEGSPASQTRGVFA